MESSLVSDMYDRGRKMTLEQFILFREASSYKWEFIDGVPYMMASGSSIHDLLILEFTTVLQTYFRGKQCESHGQYDVQLFRDVPDIVIPDACVLCDISKDNGKTIIGAPDLVLELWSLSNRKGERDDKLRMYKDEKVKEIWEIYPGSRKIVMWYLDERSNEYERFESDLFSEVESRLFPGLVVDYSLVEYRLDWDKSNYKPEL